MHKPYLNILIIGLPESQHAALVSDFRRFDASVRLNTKPLAASDLKVALNKLNVDGVFIKRKSNSSLSKLYPALKKNNPDCILIELVDTPLKDEVDENQSGLQSCRIIFDRRQVEFYLVIQFVLQYIRLKIDFRRCKALLCQSEARTSRLVNSSNTPIAYVYQGKILHANIPFLVLFKSSSMEELKRFSLLKLMDESEHGVFADFLTAVKQTPHLNVELALTLKRVTGAPFYAKVNIAPMVIRDRTCYQLWVEELPKDYKPEIIPVAQALNIWDMPTESPEPIDGNPFDQVLNKSKEKTYKESSVDVMLDELQRDESVKLRFRELYVTGGGALNRVWVDLDVIPDEFKKINTLLAKMPEVASNPLIYAHFWDQLLFRMVCDELLHESHSERIYLVTLSNSMIADTESVNWLYRVLKLLGSKSSQLMLLVNAQIQINRIPQTQKMVKLLRRAGCQIALNNFSADTTPLFLYRRIQPQAVILDSQWLDVLNEKPNGYLFLSRIVQQLESRGVSVFIPNAIQKSKDRLLVLSGASFGHEKPTKHYG